MILARGRRVVSMSAGAGGRHESAKSKGGCTT
jgi:hypothetical protein